MHNPITDRLTDGVAVSAVASPVWLPWLQQASETAALIVPILGVVWLVVQIVGYVINKKGK